MPNVLTLALAGLLLAGCAKKEATPTPDPVAESMLVRTLTFPTAGNLNTDTTYVAAAMASGASLGATELAISIGPKIGRDGIGFRIPRAALTTGLVGHL